MRRVKIIFCYNGSSFFGSQTQNNKKIPTVMGAIQEAFLKLGISQIPQVSGRTDRGVHALHQVCHVDIELHFQDFIKLKNSLNKLLLPYIYIKKIESVDDGFHARFSAKMRLYRYIISHKNLNPFIADYCLFLPEIDIKSLHDNAQIFTGEHDFGYFKKQGSETKTDIRVIYKAGAYRYKNCTILYFLGNSFLRAQVRLMCNFLFQIENGIYTTDELSSQLNKKALISTLPAEPQGLYLSRIFY